MVNNINKPILSNLLKMIKAFISNLFFSNLFKNLSIFQGWAMGLRSHGIIVPGHKSQDLGLGSRLNHLGRLKLGQISLEKSQGQKISRTA